MMERLLAKYIDFKTREEGQTMVEYAAVLALVVVMVAAITLNGVQDAITSVLSDVKTELEGIIS